MSDDVNEPDDTDVEEDLESAVGPDEGEQFDDDGLDPEFDGSDTVAFGDDEKVVDDEKVGEDDEASRPVARKVDDDDDDEEEEEDVEADLEEILRGRLATEEDDEDEDAPVDQGIKPGAVNIRKSDEFVCGICFMVVAEKQTKLPCPMGDGLEPHQPLDM